MSSTMRPRSVRILACVFVVLACFHVSMAGKGRCKLPSVTGDCRAAFNMWYYDSSAGECKQFIYGGCGGNRNRFESRAKCEAICKS